MKTKACRLGKMLYWIVSPQSTHSGKRNYYFTKKPWQSVTSHLWCWGYTKCFLKQDLRMTSCSNPAKACSKSTPDEMSDGPRSGQVILQDTRRPLLIATEDMRLGTLLLNKLGIVPVFPHIDTHTHSQKGKRHCWERS